MGELKFDVNSTDAALVRGMANCQRQALELLYDRHSGRLMGSAMRLMGNRRDAEDLVHDVFLECWQRASQYDEDRGAVTSWLLTRLHSRGIDRMRTLKLARTHALAAEPMAEKPQPPADPGFRAALGQLSEVQRTVLELCYYRGMTCTEIARHCDLPVGTIKSRLSAGLAALRRRLEETTDHA